MGSVGGKIWLAILYTGLRKGLPWKVTSEQGLNLGDEVKPRGASLGRQEQGGCTAGVK